MKIQKVPHGAATLVIAVSRDGWMVVVKDPSFKTPFWKIPGGHREEGESPAECASRELREETGIDIPWKKLLGISSKKMGGHFKYIYLGIVHSWKGLLKTGSDGEEVEIIPVKEVLKRADFLVPHKKILAVGIKSLLKEGVRII